MANYSQGQIPDGQIDENYDMDDFGFDSQSFWLDMHDGLPLSCVSVLYDNGSQTDHNAGNGVSQQPAASGPSPWEIDQSEPPVDPGISSPGQQLQAIISINQESTYGFNQWSHGPSGFQYPQANMPTPESTPDSNACTDGSQLNQEIQYNQSVSLPNHPVSLNPAIQLPTLLPPPVISITQPGIGHSGSPDAPQASVVPHQQKRQQRQQVQKEQKDEDNRPFNYALDVIPADPDDPSVIEHIQTTCELLADRHRGDYELVFGVTSLAFGNQPVSVRRYLLHDRLRRDDRIRLRFMQIFNGNRPHNLKLKGYDFKMVQVFEPRQFHTPNDDYQAIAGLGDDERVGVDGLPPFGDHDMTDLAAYSAPTAPPFPSPEPHHELDLPPLPTVPEQPATLPTPKDDIDIHTAHRSKPIPKPDRQVRKNALGKFECTWNGCEESPRAFNRKCEWNKHMDKHERPYKCQVEGCEKLAGFTYSGGLLRHEREVHSKHGGPRNPLNCPHTSCKRHKGKGFSRLENLNEHLRRVHTNPVNGVSTEDIAEDGDSVAASESGQPLQQPIQFQHQPQQAQASPQLLTVTPQKRSLEVDDETDLQSENKRLRQSEQQLMAVNAELARQLQTQKQEAEQNDANLKQELEAQKRHMAVMMAELANIRQQQQTQTEALLNDAFS